MRFIARVVSAQGPEQRVLVVPVNPVKKRGKKGGIITHREFYPVALSLDIAMKAADLAQAAFNTSAVSRTSDTGVPLRTHFPSLSAGNRVSPESQNRIPPVAPTSARR